MAVQKTGFTANTPKRYIVDAGAFYYNFDYETLTGTLLGATSGGSELAIEQELRLVEIDGVKGRTVGGQMITTDNAQFTVNLKEITAQNLKMALAGGTVDTSTDLAYDVITSKGKIELTDYLDNITYIGTLSGSTDPVIIQLFNVISLEGLAITFEDNNEAILPIVFGAHYGDDQIASGEAPYKIYYPKEVVTP